MSEELEKKIKQLYEPLRRRHEALREDLVGALSKEAVGDLAMKPKGRVPMRIIKIACASGAVAAAVIVAALVAFHASAPKVSAAEAMQVAAETSSRYDGWIHVRAVHPDDDKDTLHVNLADGTVVLDNTRGRPSRLTVYLCPKDSVFLEYHGETNTITRNGPLGADHAAGLTAIFREQMTPEGMLNALRRDDPNLAVTQTTQDNLDRFEVSGLTKGGQHTKLILLADPKTRLIQALSVFRDDKEVEAYELTYGDPVIKSIYDVGVPRDAKVVEGPLPSAPAGSLQR